MFVFSFRANKPRVVIGLCVLCVLLVGTVLYFNFTGLTVGNDGVLSAKAEDEAQRIAFLSQYGWKINEDPVEVTEVIIPSEFNETYSSYNQIQKEQSMDLEPYKGQRVKKWVYEIKNYPGYPEDCGFVRATLLITDGMVIGGDVSSLEVDGFMHGFSFPENVTEQTTTKVAS